MKKGISRGFHELLVQRGALTQRQQALALEAVEAYAFDPGRLLWGQLTAREVVKAWQLERYVEVRAA